VVSATILVYEIIINLPAEIEHIWIRKWTFLTGLYILQRYLPLFDSGVLNLYIDHGANLSTSDCTLYIKITACMFYPSAILGTQITPAICTLRVWAVWERSITVGRGLMIFLLACGVAGYILLSKFLSVSECVMSPLLTHVQLFTSHSNIYITWVLMMIYDAGESFTLFHPTIQMLSRGERTKLIDIVYRDGKVLFT
ncbi:hypothetical protein L218DRAFT_872875, partial [Marasmius fiardii PR-910]